ncbi:MAG: 16S rRNA (uracil(1498)-N(3))-methyltransferase [Actinobacteria bacterium]|nr:16S rRNA (uracil(1498)-N(3))-methyltransferase [Actinomycetota bacterium]
MSNLFFVDKISTGNIQNIENEEAHHAIKVLRLSVGELVYVSDGHGKWISGPISEISKKSLAIKIENTGETHTEKPELVVIQAFTKSDRNKEMLELVTVSGADRIIPWSSQRSISKWQSDSREKWMITVKEACKQSKRFRLPIVDNQMSTDEILNEIKIGFAIVCHESAKEKFSEISFPVNLDRIYLIIGPEGGITEKELQLFSTINATVVRLGAPILRSAHAGFAAMSALQTKIGRW